MPKTTIGFRPAERIVCRFKIDQRLIGPVDDVDCLEAANAHELIPRAVADDAISLYAVEGLEVLDGALGQRPENPVGPDGRLRLVPTQQDL
jgi:hypothetical protein